MTLSSPDSTARVWAPVELTAPVDAAGPATAPSSALFELAAVTDVPESLLAPARLAAESAGYAAGWKEGTAAAAATAARTEEAGRLALERSRDDAAAQVASAMLALQRAAQGLVEREAAASHDIEQLLLDTSFDIAEAVIGVHLADDAQRGAATLRRVLALAPPDTGVTVRLSRADHDVVRALPTLPANVTLVADATLQPGDARASVGATTIDARLSTAMERVRRALHVTST